MWRGYWLGAGARHSHAGAYIPCINGFDVHRAVRSDAALADLPILMFSADPAAEDEARRRDAQRFILKGTLDWAWLSDAV